MHPFPSRGLMAGALPSQHGTMADAMGRDGAWAPGGASGWAGWPHCQIAMQGRLSAMRFLLPVKVRLSHIGVYVNNVFCKQESSMISGTYALAWARVRRCVQRGPGWFGRRFRRPVEKTYILCCAHNLLHLPNSPTMHHYPTPSGQVPPSNIFSLTRKIFVFYFIFHIFVLPFHFSCCYFMDVAIYSSIHMGGVYG